MQNFMRRVGVLLGVFGLVLAVQAANYYVATNGSDAADGASWATAKQTLHAGLALAGNNDVVTVSNGTYALTNQLELTQGITLRSLNGAAVTFISGSQTTRCAYVSHADAVMEGFTITQGRADGSGYGGGGVYMYAAGTVKDCIISNNVCESGAGRGGAGVYIENGGLLTNCQVLNNVSVKEGGGVFTWFGGSVVLSVIKDNQATRGGGMYSHMYGGTVSNNLFAGNTATTDGGGVNVYGNGMTLVDCVLSNNVAPKGGGALFVTGGSMVRGQVIHNTA